MARKQALRTAAAVAVIMCLLVFLVACSAPAAKEPPSPSGPGQVTVYITRTGEKYHRAGCRYLSKSMIPMALETAKARGYTPCSVCKPPS
jgi:hypothetical protein